jgi:predicted trehalose synthase
MSHEGTTPTQTRMVRRAEERVQRKLDRARNAPTVQVPELRGQPANVREQLRRLRPSNM